MAANIVKVPPSLGNYPATSSPLYLTLTYAGTQNLGKWRKVENFAPDGAFLLPPPKVGLGTSTQSNVSDDVSQWNASLPLGERVRMLTSDTAFYALGKASELFGSGGADYDYVAGGGAVPPDLSSLQFKGMKKRAYNFSFQLFAYDQGDAEAIADFVETMHALCLPAGVQFQSNSGVKKMVFAPAIFRPIITDLAGNIPKGWLVEPQPCTMLTFNTSGGQYASQFLGNPAVITVNMLMAEIEPIYYDAQNQVIRQMWRNFTTK